MSIVIKTEKVVYKGVAKYEVLGIEALELGELPRPYLDSEPHCYKSGESLKIFYDGVFFVSKGETYTTGEMKTRLDLVKKCGEWLAEINKEIKKLEEKWKGKETFII